MCFDNNFWFACRDGNLHMLPAGTPAYVWDVDAPRTTNDTDTMGGDWEAYAMCCNRFNSATQHYPGGGGDCSLGSSA